ncbi:MAG: isocitrate/isopropylmalate dehydrogenase family protein [Candidatus Omnitrophica bacterium]|nr:isocitrate/isopropylmalate dehydrogenase family protein [Candidatus Omnitrophota bacterium]MBU4478478.1 isocitrate/isopropylmalate dehydrogenase family protein [Candidatus Omnitrophota bacterium]MCG2703779.1 isocitrate/isopropylmalate dehydrogenase family protein [Candidatus Omnitrophota bacterium]
MAQHNVTFIPGDGIGPEVSAAARRCVEATGIDIVFEEVNAGAETLEKTGRLLPDSVSESIKKNKTAIKGPITTPVGSGFRSVNVALRKAHDLYACVRPCKSYEGVRSRYENIDLVIVRENTEDLYAGIEFEVGRPETGKLIEQIKALGAGSIRSDSGISIKPISIYGTRRIVKFAFEYALAHKRRKVTAVHKANIMKYTDGLFLSVAREVAKEYASRIEFEDRIVDNMCMQLVQRPEAFDVIVLPNLYGDIISDLCAGLVGGLGVAPGANIGETIALFEATHGSAPKYKGLNKVNPAAMILSAVLMLDYLKEKKAAQMLEQATAEVFKEGKAVTYDFKENRDDTSAVGTKEMADAIIAKIKKKR